MELPTGAVMFVTDMRKQDFRVVVIHQKNGGISNARNSALRIAKGKYIAFCDHDDEMLPCSLENAVVI